MNMSGIICSKVLCKKNILVNIEVQTTLPDKHNRYRITDNS